MLIRPLIANGITLNGFKFMCIQATPEEVIGRKGVSLCSTLHLQFLCRHIRQGEVVEKTREYGMQNKIR